MSRICLVMDFKVEPGTKARFLETIREHAVQTLASEEGCLRFEVCDPLEGGGRVFLYEMYVGEAAPETHKASLILARTRERYADVIESRDIHVCKIL